LKKKKEKIKIIIILKIPVGKKTTEHEIIYDKGIGEEKKAVACEENCTNK